jgi:hypothetical protein
MMEWKGEKGVWVIRSDFAECDGIWSCRDTERGCNNAHHVFMPSREANSESFCSSHGRRKFTRLLVAKKFGKEEKDVR